MARFSLPPKAKVYEAITAVADGRVVFTGTHRASVESSARNKSYVVTWDESLSTFGSNDNGSYWRGYLGYPIIAVLIALRRIPCDQEVLGSLASVPWKVLNDKHRRNYDAAIAEALARISDHERNRIVATVEEIYQNLSSLELSRQDTGAPPVD